MIRVSVFNDDLSHNFDTSVRLAEELGIKYMELRNVEGKRIDNITDDNIKNIKRILKSTSVQLCSIGTPVFSKGCEVLDDALFKEHRAILDTMFKACHELDLNRLRVFGFDKPKAEFKHHHLDDYFNRIVDRLEEPVRAAEKEGVVLMFEPEHETYLGTAKDLSRIVKHFNSDSVKVCWDVCNSWNAGDIPYPDGYPLIKDDIVHVHVKDAKLDPVTKKVISDRMVIGKGDLPWSDIMATLHKDGYNGYATIECPFAPWNAELRSYLMDFIKGDIAGLRAALKKAGVPQQ